MQFDEIMPFLIPIIIFMIPIIAILTAHQRKMAELMLEKERAQMPNSEITALRNEIQELKHLVHQQSIAIDNLAGRSTPVTLEERIRLNG